MNVILHCICTGFGMNIYVSSSSCLLVVDRHLPFFQEPILRKKTVYDFINDHTHIFAIYGT